MCPRPYRAGRRAEAAEETRRRIVEATFALHAERGIAATSMKQIAARANVSVGTVYHHFPTYEDAVVACGRHTDETTPAPTSAIFEGAGDRESRIGRLVAAYFDYYARLPILDRLRCDAGQVPVLRAFLAESDRHRRALIAEALGPGAQARAVDLVMALTDPAVHASLLRSGRQTAEAAREIVQVICAAPQTGAA